MKTISISQWVAAAVNSVAASRQSAANYSEKWRRSAETPLRRSEGNPSLCALLLFALLTTSVYAQVNRTIGTLPPGGTVTVTFDVTINTNFPLNTFSVTNQGSVSGNAITTVLTDDPGVGGASDPTVSLLPADLDFGDAPAPYPTLLANNGARHIIPFTGATLFLGNVPPDAEADGQPNATATGDNLAGANDEDGVTFNGGFTNSTTAQLTVRSSAPGKLDAWIDFNRNGNWSDAGEQVIVNQTLAAGDNLLAVSVPVIAANTNTFARFRLSSAGNLTPTNQAADGEVEDYEVQLVASVPPQVTCPTDIFTNIPSTNSSVTIAFAAAATGNPTPTVTYTLNGNPITSPYAFAPGTNLVQTTASNGLPPNAACSFSVIVNRNPLAVADQLGTVETNAATVAAAKLRANDSDPDGDAIAITAVSATSTNGGAVVLASGAVTYTPVGGFVGEDRFSYTLTDARGGTATGTVMVTVTSASAPSQNKVSITPTASGVLIRFSGIPGQAYNVQYSDGAPTGPWTSFVPPIIAGPTGLISYEDTTFPAPPSRFYRTSVAP